MVLMTPFDDDDLAWYAREHDPEFLASLAEARRQVERGETVSHAELKKEFGLDSHDDQGMDSPGEDRLSSIRG